MNSVLNINTVLLKIENLVEKKEIDTENIVLNLRIP